MSAPSQIRKAAVVVAALDSDAADALLERLSPEHAAIVRRALVDLGEVDADERAAATAEFLGRPALDVETPKDAGISLAGRGARPVPFEYLRDAVGVDLTQLLDGERPQVIAVVVSHLPSDKAAEVLAVLTPSVQADVMRRLARLDAADPVVLADIDAELRRRFQGAFRNERGRAAGLGAVKDILSEAAPEQRRSLLSNIARHDPQFAERLSPSTIVYDDLPRLADASLRAICDAVDFEALVIALAGGELAFTRRIVAAVPRLQGVRLQAAIDSLGPTPLSDIEPAQDELVRAARQLETIGRLDWIQAPATAG